MFIHSFCSISPAGVLEPGADYRSLQPLSEARNSCIEPDYKDIISPMQLRRMTKPVRTGVAAAKIALDAAAIAVPDSLHVGTAYGMLQDSEHFLEKMIAQQEQMLTPTSFIQSTHNTVSGQIALSLGCHGHNMTFVHKGHSFENALLDAELLLTETAAATALVGAVEECTATSFSILRRFNVYDQEQAGEGAAFFCLSAERGPGALARILAFETFESAQLPEVKEWLLAFYSRYETGDDGGAMVLDGSGDAAVGMLFPVKERIRYKDFCGAYPVASSFALALSVLILESAAARLCWIVNRSGSYWSCWCVVGG